jgi:hypothetical protein
VKEFVKGVSVYTGPPAPTYPQPIMSMRSYRALRFVTKFEAHGDAGTAYDFGSNINGLLERVGLADTAYVCVCALERERKQVSGEREGVC